MTDTQPALRAGSLIAGRYELVELIGQGGHGEVWKARDKVGHAYVAVKLLNDVAARDPQQIERLKREQQALVALAGTSAVGIIDLCRAPGGRMCLVLELLEGIDLEQHLDRLAEHGERMEIPDLVAILDPIVATLERAHQAGILHRDLKPANVFLLQSGGVRLLDFGLARLRRSQPLTAAGMILGSPSYIAPEVWIGSTKGLDQRVDVYSLGVIIFRALAGRVPFEGQTLQQKFIATTTAQRPSLHALRPELSLEIDEWVEEVLAIDPDNRFNTVRGAWTALLAVLRVPGLAERLVSPEDLASIGGGAALGMFGSEPPPAKPPSRPAAKLAAPRPAATPSVPRVDAKQESIGGHVRAAAEAVRRWTHEVAAQLKDKPSAPPPRLGYGEKSMWLSPDDLYDEQPAPAPSPPPPPARPSVPKRPPPPPRPGKTPAAPPTSLPRAGGFQPLTPVRATPGKLVGDAPADDKRSFVSEWLAGSELRAPEPAQSAGEDVIEWLGGPTKDGSTTSKMRAIRAPTAAARPKPPSPASAPPARKKRTIRSFTPVPDDKDDLEAIFSMPEEPPKPKK